MVQQLINQYWGIAAVLLVLLIYVPTHFKLSKAYAKKIALQFIFAAEKRAEDLLLTTGQQRLDWVENTGYNFLPPLVRLVISKPLFKILAQQVYDMAVSFAKKHQAAAPVVDPQVSAPV